MSKNTLIYAVLQTFFTTFASIKSLFVKLVDWSFGGLGDFSLFACNGIYPKRLNDHSANLPNTTNLLNDESLYILNDQTTKRPNKNSTL